VRFWAFVISGAAGGFAGGLYAPVAQLLTPELAHWSHSALPILYCLVGGVAYFWGPVVGVVVFIGLEHATRNITGLSEVVIGFVLLVVVLAFPGGLIGGLKQLLRPRSSHGAPLPSEPARADVKGTV
jgi:branched-chain amino acid transport system permease protein